MRLYVLSASCFIACNRWKKIQLSKTVVWYLLCWQFPPPFFLLALFFLDFPISLLLSTISGAKMRDCHPCVQNMKSCDYMYIYVHTCLCLLYENALFSPLSLFLCFNLHFCKLSLNRCLQINSKKREESSFRLKLNDFPTTKPNKSVVFSGRTKYHKCTSFQRVS